LILTDIGYVVGVTVQFDNTTYILLSRAIKAAYNIIISLRT